MFICIGFRWGDAGGRSAGVLGGWEIVVKDLRGHGVVFFYLGEWVCTDFSLVFCVKECFCCARGADVLLKFLGDFMSLDLLGYFLVFFPIAWIMYSAVCTESHPDIIY